MSHTTLGIDINQNSIRYAVCTTNAPNLPITILHLETIRLTPTENDDGLDEGFKELAHQLEQFKKQQIDAIGLALDPTVSMSLHRVLPFEDPKVIEQILPQTLMDVWKIDDNCQIAFERGKLVPGKPGAEGEEAQDGYDIHVINYPREKLSHILDRMKLWQIDPHVALPSTEALSYAIQTMFTKVGGAYVILDIGSASSMLSVINEDKVEMTRALKIGSNNIDEAISNAFGISREEAKNLKEKCGFLAVPGTESIQYNTFTSLKRIAPCECDPTQLATVCSQGLTVLLTAVRQTLTNFVAQTKIEPECIYLSGGGSQLCGIAEWLSELFDVKCVCGLPLSPSIPMQFAKTLTMDIDAASIAIAAGANIDGGCPLNLRRGALAHKGNLAYIQEHKWLIASCVLLVMIALVFMTTTKTKAIQKEHDALKAALESTTEKLFGEKMTNSADIHDQIEMSNEFDVIPSRSAFSHFAWISNNVNDNLADTEMDLSSIDIDTQRKTVTLIGDATGDEGLPNLIQLLETYECFPREILPPNTKKSNGRTNFTLRIDANHCSTGDKE